MTWRTLGEQPVRDLWCLGARQARPQSSVPTLDRKAGGTGGQEAVVGFDPGAV